MQISAQTKKEVNTYTVNHIKTKGIVGYIYFKALLETMVELYHQQHSLPIVNLKELHALTDFDVTYQSLQKSIFYFLKKEKIETPIIDTLINMTEDIINMHTPNFFNKGVGI